MGTHSSFPSHYSYYYFYYDYITYAISLTMATTYTTQIAEAGADMLVAGAFVACKNGWNEIMT